MIKSYFGSKKGLVKYIYSYLLWLCLGKYKDYMILPRVVRRVVFVCKGNICRSPFAKVVFESISSFPSGSVGLDTTSGCGAHPPIKDISFELGYDLSKHLTTAWVDFKAKEGDLYVCTEPDHVREVLIRLPGANVVLIGLFLDSPSVYIHDPYNCVQAYRLKCLKLLLQSTKNFADILSNNISRNSDCKIKSGNVGGN